MYVAGAFASEAERSTRELGRTSCPRGARPFTRAQRPQLWLTGLVLSGEKNQLRVLFCSYFNVLYPYIFLCLSSVTSAQRIFFWSDLCSSQGLSKQSPENGRTSMGDFSPVSFRRHAWWLSNILLNSKSLPIKV